MYNDSVMAMELAVRVMIGGDVLSEEDGTFK